MTGEKCVVYGHYATRSGGVREVYQTKYKSDGVGKLWMWTKDGTHDQPTNKRYLTSEADRRSVTHVL